MNNKKIQKPKRSAEEVIHFFNKLPGGFTEHRKASDLLKDGKSKQGIKEETEEEGKYLTDLFFGLDK